MDDLLAEFLTETSESMDTLDVELVKLEQDPNDPELLGNIFRMVHTVKGTCGFLGLPRLEAVAHASENVLGKVREGQLEVTPYAISLVLQSLDQIKAICAEIEQNEKEPEGSDAELIGQLNDLADGRVDGTGAPVAGAAPAVVVAPKPALAPITAEAEPAGETASDGGFPVASELLAEYEEATGGSNAGAQEESAFPVAAELLAEYEEATGGAEEAPAALVEVAEAAEPIEVVEPVEAAEAVESIEAAEPVEVVEVAEAAKEKPAKQKAKAGGAAKEKSAVAQSIRVNVDVLENLMTMVSELVLTRNQLMQIHRAHDDSDDFAAPFQTLNHIVSELQEGVMQTRMQPIGNAWSKLPRIIRDLSLELGKKIDLQMIGQETELDRQVLEMIRDPLTHMVRNSGDHAIETPAERKAAGKQETGTVTLRAFHEGGHIIIQIKDDGRGLAVDKIKQKILDNELATEAELEGFSDTQIQQFIFKAGFSTAAKVTSVSGRGVGMDVVRTNIEKIGGTVELQSTEGKGTVFTIKIPLTLAIVSALIVECAGDRFAIPQISVLELVRASSKSETRIEMVKDSPVLRLRDRLLPLVSLRELLGFEGVPDEPAALPVVAEDSAPVVAEGEANVEAKVETKVEAEHGAEGADDAFIVVTQVGAQSFGIIVDRVFDTEEIVVKPVAPILRDIQLFSGNTILGDGSVIMILDPNGIAAQSGEMTISDSADDAQSRALAGRASERVTMLIFRAVDGAPKAVPLALVARLEEFDIESIEQSDSQAVVQYRGQLMPLIMFNQTQALRETGRQPVLVFTDETRAMGLVVDEIVDIIETEMAINISSETPGMVGSAIIAGKATDVVDTGYYLTQAYPDWFKTHGNEAYGDSGERRVLLVDDSAFFRNMITPLLQVAGYDVTTAESAIKALDLCEAGAEFDLIISDIEMPGMSGFEFTEKIRAEGAWKEVPVVALTSHTAPQDLDRGRAAGFTDYIGKFDRDALLQSVSDTLSMARGAA